MTSAAGVERVEIRNFRCFSQAAFSPHLETNLILGPNGSGKTTILEALHVLGVGRSFRVRELSPLVRHGEMRFEVKALLNPPRQVLDVRGGAGGLDSRLNDQELRGSSELAAILPVQALHPEMHALIEGPPEGRRRFLDFGVFHVKPGYLDAWRRYYRALRQRNAALKASHHRRDLEVWDSEMIRTGEIVDSQRRQ
jgi:DNA replication and repair protein RecF